MVIGAVSKCRSMSLGTDRGLSSVTPFILLGERNRLSMAGTEHTKGGTKQRQYMLPASVGCIQLLPLASCLALVCTQIWFG